MNAAALNPNRQRLPAIVSLLLFAALCASIAYWVLQWLAPAPRAVAAPVASEQVMPPVAAAANLFGGAAKGSGVVNVQLRGIIHAGSASGSVAIMTVDGSAPKFYRLHAELMPGVTVKAIHARTVVLSERGAERELVLPAFAAQESTSGAAVRAMPEQSPQQVQPAAQPQPAAPQPQQPVSPQGQLQVPQPAAQVAGPSALGSDAAGGEEPQLQNPRAARNARRPRYRDE